jgi:hypothetical protein
LNRTNGNNNDYYEHPGIAGVIPLAAHQSSERPPKGKTDNEVNAVRQNTKKKSKN